MCGSNLTFCHSYYFLLFHKHSNVLQLCDRLMYLVKAKQALKELPLYNAYHKKLIEVAIVQIDGEETTNAPHQAALPARTRFRCHQRHL